MSTPVGKMFLINYFPIEIDKGLDRALMQISFFFDVIEVHFVEKFLDPSSYSRR